MRPRFPRILCYAFLALFLAAAGVTAAYAAWTAHRRTAEDIAWRELTRLIPTQPRPPEGAQISEEGISFKTGPNRDQYGYVTLANGEVWRFAFRSHHLLGGLDSYSIFTGPLGTYRVEGGYFCCEVQFIGENDRPPADSPSFLAKLRKSNPTVCPVPAP